MGTLYKLPALVGPPEATSSAAAALSSKPEQPTARESPAFINVQQPSAVQSSAQPPPSQIEEAADVTKRP